MENGLATLKFRRPNEDEIENHEQAIELTSRARWDPSYISGNDFLPGADHDLIARVPGVDNNKIINKA